MKWIGRIFFIAALILIASTTDWRQFVRVFQRVDTALVMAAFAFLLGIDLFRAWKMALMAAGGEPVGKRTMLFYRYNMASGFYALVLPGDVLGGGVRWLYYRNTVGGTDAAWMVILDNYSQFLAVFLLFVPAVFFISHSMIPGMLVVGIMAAMITGPFLMRRTEFLSRVTPEKPLFISKTVRYLNEKMKTFRVVNARMLALFSISFVYQCLITFFVWMLSVAAGITIGLDILVFAVTGMTIIQLIPGLLGGIGIREASLTGMLLPFGVSTEEAVLLGLLISLITIARGLTGGLAVLTIKVKT